MVYGSVILRLLIQYIINIEICFQELAVFTVSRNALGITLLVVICLLHGAKPLSLSGPNG